MSLLNCQCISFIQTFMSQASVVLHMLWDECEFEDKFSLLPDQKNIFLFLLYTFLKNFTRQDEFLQDSVSQMVRHILQPLRCSQLYNEYNEDLFLLALFTNCVRQPAYIILPSIPFKLAVLCFQCFKTLYKNVSKWKRLLGTKTCNHLTVNLRTLQRALEKNSYYKLCTCFTVP